MTDLPNIHDERHTCHRFLFGVREDGFTFYCERCKEEVVIPFEAVLVLIATAMSRATQRVLQLQK